MAYPFRPLKEKLPVKVRGLAIKFMYCHPNFIHKNRFSPQELQIVRGDDIKGLKRKFLKMMERNEYLETENKLLTDRLNSVSKKNRPKPKTLEGGIRD